MPKEVISLRFTLEVSKTRFLIFICLCLKMLSLHLPGKHKVVSSITSIKKKKLFTLNKLCLFGGSSAGLYNCADIGKLTV